MLGSHATQLNHALLTACVAAVLTSVLGAVVLLGWAFDIPALKGLLPDLATMKPNTALCFVFSGTALWLLSTSSEDTGRWRRRGVVALALAVGLVAVLTLAEYIFALDLGIDRLLFGAVATAEGSPYPGRMSPATALMFALTGGALALGGGRRASARLVAQLLAVGTGVLAAVALLGYAYDVRALYQVGPYASVALHTALAFLVVATGMLCALRDSPPMSIVGADLPSARLARRLLLALVIVVPLLGWLRLQGQEAGWYSTEFGLALMVVTSTVILAGVILFTTHLANLADERIFRANRLYALLSHTNQSVVHVRDRDALLHEICRGTVEVGGFKTAWIGWVGEDGEVTEVAARAGADEDFTANALRAARERPDVRERFSRIVAGAQPVVLSDLARFPVSGERGRELLRLGYRSIAGLQIRSGGRVRALLMVYSIRPENFDAAELRLLGEIATDVGFALDQLDLDARRHQAEGEVRQLNVTLAEQAERLRILHEIDRGVISEESPQAIAAAVIRPLRELLGVPRAIVNLFDLAAGEVEWLAAAGRRRVHLGPGVRYSMQLMGDVEALKRGEPQRIDVNALPRSPETDALLASGVHLYMVVPMITGGELIGALSFGGAPGPFPPERVGIAQEVATQLAIAIAQARLHDRVKRQAAELELRVCERTAQLEAANQELESFSYSVSHDLRAPLRAIDGFSHMLEEDYGGRLDAEARRLLGVVRSGTLRMARLIDDLLELSRTGRTPLARRNVDMSALANEAAKEIVQTVEGAPPEIATAALPPAWGDAALLRQVWLNLIGNAVKYSGRRAEPRVEISGWQDGPKAVYCVADNGAGFDMRYRDKLFGVFQRLHRQEEFGGTGIGLAIVHRILMRHGGAVWAEGKVDEGASFFFSLPWNGEPGSP
ncbi:MAG TPA: GAF domain-containing protein [Burkholderiales bacterium]|nr:GAF domain-containing protein [Burkholderiales bacterium]